MAQKGGAVACHARIARTPDDIHAIRTSLGGSDLVLGGDLVVTASPAILGTMAAGRTCAVVNSHEILTGDFTRQPALQLPARRMRREIEERAVAGRNWFFDAHRLAERVFGDSIGANMLLLGYAYQLGLVPVGAAAIEQAIELNGAAVEMNRRAFDLGRRVAHDPGLIDGLVAAQSQPAIAGTADDLIARRAAFLARYQDEAYAERYRASLSAIRAAEQRTKPGEDALARTAAETLFKLMAYKDEYEVARLYTDGSFAVALKEQFDGGGRVTLHLAPPLLSKVDPATGRPKKLAFGPWILPVLRQLAKFKRLRGTAWDVFGRSTERRMERRLIIEYEALLADVARDLRADNHATAVALFGAAREIKGFGPVKLASMERAKRQEAELFERFRANAPVRAAAE